MRGSRTIAVGIATLVMAFGFAACGDDNDDGTGAAGTSTSLGSATGGTAGPTLEFMEQNASGVTGTAMLAEDNGQTTVTLQLANAAGPSPAHIHKGTCASLDPAPLYPLTDVTDGASATTVPASLDDLQRSPHAINVHESAANIEKYIACTDIPANGTGGSGTSTSSP